MASVLQIALCLASVSIVVFVVLLIPVLLGIRRHMGNMAHELAEMKTDVTLLVQDSRAMVQHINQLTTQAQQPIDELNQSFRLVHNWLERVDRLVHQAGDLVEGPIFTTTRILNCLVPLLQVWIARERSNTSTAGKT